MAEARTKPDIITFKVDPSLAKALRRVPNRSEFIRAAILGAMENLCPLCEGRGLLTPNQKAHWLALAATHGIDRCRECHESHLVCKGEPAKDVHQTSRT